MTRISMQFIILSIGRGENGEKRENKTKNTFLIVFRMKTSKFVATRFAIFAMKLPCQMHQISVKRISRDIVGMYACM